MSSFVPYGRQNISEEDIQAVVRALRSDFLTQGPEIQNFETKLCEYTGAKYAVATSNATAALHLACLAAGLGNNDTLWTSPNSFLASANCGLYCGANVDFVDIDENSYNISVKQLADKLKKTSAPKVLVPVHFAGQSCDMKEIRTLTELKGTTIIEDASHAIGGNYLNQKVGSCEFSDMSIFSFHPVKIITTGEGGVILTNREDLYEKLLILRSHGMTREERFLTRPKEGPWSYEQIELGMNYRITDLQAALGSSQLKRLDLFVKRRHEIVARYNELLKSLPVITPWQNPETYSAFHLYVIQLDPKRTSKTRLEVFESLQKKNIGVNVHYIPIHTQPYYQNLGFKWGDFPRAENYYRHAITLPLYFDLTIEQQDRVVSALTEALR